VPSELLHTIEGVSSQLATLLAETKRALSGESDFGVEQVRALSQPVAAMAPIMARAAELQSLHPEIAAPLDHYKSLLRELQTALDRVRVMLLARRSQMDAGRVQLDAVSNWANALSHTR
jgi:hypothetical protein